jgi:hypothetical protein
MRINSRALRPSKRLRGQNLYLFLGLLIPMMMLLGAVIDFGRFMLLHAQAASLADSAARSAANALDLNGSISGNWVLNQTVANRQAQNIFQYWQDNRLVYESWMEIRLERVEINKTKVRVIVVAECDPWFLGAIGVKTFSVRVEGYARAAIGIIKEEN